MKVEQGFFKNNKLSIITILLSWLLLLILGYLIAFHPVQRSHINEDQGKKIIISLEETMDSKVIVPVTKEMLSIIEEKIDERPIITIALNDFGLNKSNSDLALTLPEEVAFMISVYNPIEYQNLTLARNLLLNIPMVPMDYSDSLELKPLSPNDSNQDNLKRLNNILSFYQRDASNAIKSELTNKKIYQAVYSDERELYTKGEKEAKEFIAQLKQHNLIYLCGIMNKNAMIYKIAKKIDFHLLKNNVILDEELSSLAITSQLQKLEEIAQKQGYAIATASQYRLTIEVLKSWLPSLVKKNIRLVSIEDFYKITNQRRAQ